MTAYGRMKAVIHHTPEERERLTKLSNETLSAVGELKNTELFNDYKVTPAYHRYTFCGNIANLLVEKLGHMPTPEELIIIVDRGINHFGADCYIDGIFFSGEISTD